MRQTSIKYLRHPNGRGKLLDDSDVAKSAYLSADSIAAGSCMIKGGEVHKSLVTDRALITGGHLYKCIVKDFAQVYETPKLYKVVMEGSARVYGNARIEGDDIIRLHGKMRVNYGHWTRAPRYVDLGFESVTESKLGAMVGCRDRTVDYWLKHGPKLAKRWGMTNEQIEALIRAVMEVSQCQ